MKKLRTIGAEIILGTIVLPWVVWVTLFIFETKTANAVQDNQYDFIVKSLSEIKTDIREIRETHAQK